MEIQGYTFSILVVDDNSPDGTFKVVERLKKKDNRIFLLRRKAKLGLGSAYMEGFRLAIRNLSFDILIQMDADFSHSPEDTIRLVAPIMNGADVAIASRYIEEGGSQNWSFHRRLISRTANFLASRLLNIHVNDITSGFRAMNRKAVSELLNYQVSSKGYSFQVESLAIYENVGLNIIEVPFIFRNRLSGKAKLSFLEILQFVGALLSLSICGLRLKEE
jgi:dolichol-phosphate mannosyltransferase